MITPRRPPSIIESFNYAIEGIIHVLRTQRNMRIHFAVAVVVLVAALVSDVSRLEIERGAFRVLPSLGASLDGVERAQHGRSDV